MLVPERLKLAIVDSISSRSEWISFFLEEESIEQIDIQYWLTEVSAS